MCGIVGILAPGGATPSLDERGVVRMRDRLAHRGPDGAGYWARGAVALAHRRLSVIDLSDAGAQPMATEEAERGEGGFVIVYNGMLYDDREVRSALEQEGVRFRSKCDTETVLRAFARWGVESLFRLRGMFAFAVWDVQRGVLTLARDALGIKPLYFAEAARADGGREFVFGSEIPAILAHPGVERTPNMAMVSGYLTTIRTVLGNETMYRGVHALGPGEMAQVMADAEGRLDVRLMRWWGSVPDGSLEVGSVEEAGERVRGALEESVGLHLRADVATCALLSGGIDSTVLTMLARDGVAGLRTYCAGATDGEDAGDDLEWARRVAKELGTEHYEAIVTREMFREKWAWMVGRLGVPLSTPNEVAIHAVAKCLRDDGCIVTISGEGADELLAGYDGVLLHARAAIESGSNASFGEMALRAGAWMGAEVKAEVFRAELWEAIGGDAWLVEWYEREGERARKEAFPEGMARGDALAAVQRMVRRVNLTGLLQRLDTATMLAGVEGRTAFADARVAQVCEGLPMWAKFAVGEDGSVETKRALRAGFAGRIPNGVSERRKQSFPLPFQRWIADGVAVLRDGKAGREWFRRDAVEAVCDAPGENWHLAWPMMNVAIWCEGLSEVSY